MRIFGWLRKRRGEGGINLINRSQFPVNVRVVGINGHTPPSVPGYQEYLVRVRPGTYSVRFEREDQIETFQVDGIKVVEGMATPVILSGKAKQGTRVRMVRGPV